MSLLSIPELENSIYFTQLRENEQNNVAEKLFIPHGGVLKEYDEAPAAASVNLYSVTTAQTVQCLHKPVPSRFTLIHQMITIGV